MKTSYWFVLGVIAACGVQIASCSSSFKSCEDSRTCASGADAAGESTGGTAENAAGDTGAAARGGTDSTGGVADTGGTDNGGADNGGATDCEESLDACSGSCANLDKDPINCGACGHDCLGGDCILGVCQPIEIAKDQGFEMIVVVDDQFIYWGGDSAVVGKKSIDNSGQAVELVPASAHERAYFGALVGQTFYWDNDWADNGVLGCALPTCAGGPSLLIPTPQPPEGLIYNASVVTLYWAQGSSLWHKALPAGVASQFVVTTHAASLLKSDDSFVYWAESDSTAKTAEIRKVPLSGGSSSSLAMGLTGIDDLAPYGKNLFVVTSSATSGMDIVTVALPNGIGAASPKLFAPAGEETLTMRVDDSGVYWTQHDGANGSIRHCPLAGCAGDTEILATSTTPWGITTDSKAVYWTTQDGFVMKLAK